jgi:hypothetical protein
VTLRHPIVTLLCWLLFASAAAQGPWWTVQTVALRQLAEAEAEAARLRGMGFPAYTERTMRDGSEFIRVRVGCIDNRELAEGWAGVLKAGVTPAAVPVPIEGLVPLSVPCVAVEVGFRKPEGWTILSGEGEVPTFGVEVAGTRGHLRYLPDGWRLAQGEPATVVLLEPRWRQTTVVQTRVAGQAVVTSAHGFLCPGVLIATFGEVAIIDWHDSVIACSVVARG